MSHHGPSGGPYPGRPSDPWSDRQDGYIEPSDPWGGQALPSPGYAADYPPPHYPVPGHPSGAGPAWPVTGPPTGRKPRRTPLIAALVTLAVLVCGGGATGIYLLGQSQGRKTDEPTVLPTGATGPTGQATNTTEATTSPTPGAPSPTDAQFVKVGECVKNEGDTSKPKLTITPCAPKTYEVLQRFDGATDGEDDAKAKCSKVPGYTDWYFFNSGFDALDFVLCLKLR
ncbi:hypothetical protein GCM10027290_34050 [Micromonospora sonneratiae]|uniref:Uncharacterized protein n=1 Tax=Micromonospora sonneratiae TaxID=1184706 RepID=A0ABW3YK16_9ACTN